jgi:hypothetical protein
MLRQFMIALAAFAVICGCGSPVASPSQAASPSPAPSTSPTLPSERLLVFVKPGAVALVRPDGTVVDMKNTKLDSADIAQYEFDLSDAALIGRYWGADGNPTLPLQFGIYDRMGRLTAIAPSAAKVLSDVNIFLSPIVVAGHDLLATQLIVPETGPWSSAYVKLDLASGEVTRLLTATSIIPDKLPPGATEGPLPGLNMTPLGTTSDGSIARIMVVNAVVNGISISGAAYFEIDLRSLAVTGPHALPNVGASAISADARYAAWTEFRVGDRTGVRDLHVLELATGHETTVLNVPFFNEVGHGGIKFSPDNAYLSLEGYGAGSMGIAVFDLRSSRLVRSVRTIQPDEPNWDVPMWWTDSHTVVFQTNDVPTGTKLGHRLDVVTGILTDYPSELGAPVLMLG